MCFRIKLLPRGLVQVLLIGLFAGCWTEYSPTEARAAETPVIKGIVLIADQAQLRKIDGNTSAKTFLDTTATPWIDAAKLGEKLTPFQDRELDKLSADLVVAAITNYHKDVLDEPFVNVYTPPQEVTAGILQVVVQRGVLGRITVEGEEWYSEESYLRYIPIQPGQPIKMSRVNAGVDAINHSGFRLAKPEAMPGAEPGQTDIVVKTEERFPVSVHGGYNNTGTRLTSRYRYNVGTTWGNAFGIGHELSYNFSIDPSFEFNKSHSFGYYAPLANGDGISLSAALGHTKSRLPEPFDQSGTSKSLAGRYVASLPDWTAFGVNHSISAGLDFKRADNQLEFNQIAVNAATTDVVQFAAEYNASRQDSWGATSARIGFFLSPGNLSAFNTDERFSSTRQGAPARYHYINGDIGRSFDLPEGFGLSHRLIYQFSPYRLIGSEQLGVTGYGAVRGYPESDAFGDYGFVLRNEFQLPVLSPQQLLSLDIPEDRLRFHVFYDVANARQQSPLDGETDSVWLRSVGVGVTYALGHYVSARFDAGRGLSRNPDTQAEGTQIHFGLTLSY